MALSTEDSNDSQKRMRYYSPNPRVSVLFTHPTPVSPCLAQRGSDMRGSTVLTRNFSRIALSRMPFKSDTFELGRRVKATLLM